MEQKFKVHNGDRVHTIVLYVFITFLRKVESDYWMRSLQKYYVLTTICVPQSNLTFFLIHRWQKFISGLNYRRNITQLSIKCFLPKDTGLLSMKAQTGACHWRVSGTLIGLRTCLTSNCCKLFGLNNTLLEPKGISVNILNNCWGR